MIFSTPWLLPECLSVISEVNSIRARLKHALATPRQWLGMLRRNTFARAIRGSNGIEGYNVTKDDAIAAVDGEEPMDAERETWAAISGYRNALTYVLQLATDPHFRYSEGFIRSLHYMMLNYDLKRHPGTWRLGPIYVRDKLKQETVYEGPDVDSVPSLMTELMDSLNADTGVPAIVRAAMGHLNLVMIHPFSDGNGRMARCLQTLILAREGILDPRFCSIEEYLGRNTNEYYAILAHVGGGTWQPQNDARPWLRFCLNAHFNQATTLLRRTKEIERVWSELEEMIHALDLPERTIYALSDATFGYRIRNATYRTVAEISDSLASRDLKILVAKGLLVPTGEKRGRVYVASDKLKSLRERTREPKPVYKPVTPQLFLPGMGPAAVEF
ncbi:MAG: Fic family protein [Acidobacteria bacterium]|nr:Fic family protein [Acidobacteriota bacterium]